MRTTASYDLFPDAPSERAMARARWLAREGRVADAEDAYRGVLATHPDLKPCWAEYFELLRRSGRRDDALQLAGRALAQFGATGFALALEGAALMELERIPDALASLERAAEADPDLALVWHELGVAAWKLGDGNRALLALDRAFALEPHTETLRLRGRILRAAGRYPAAEVAFEGAAQAAEHPEQREEAEREILATRRYAFYAPRRPDQLAPAEEWFAQTGVAVLAPDPGPVAPSDDTLVATLLEVAGDRGWQVGQIVVVGPSLRGVGHAARRPDGARSPDRTARRGAAAAARRRGVAAGRADRRGPPERPRVRPGAPRGADGAAPGRRRRRAHRLGGPPRADAQPRAGDDRSPASGGPGCRQAPASRLTLRPNPGDRS